VIFTKSTFEINILFPAVLYTGSTKGHVAYWTFCCCYLS